MKATDAVISIMKKVGKTNATLAESMSSGNKTYNTRLVNDRLHQNDMTIGKLDEMVRAMGYKVMIVPDDKTVDEALKGFNTYRVF